jgi:hypothetical protein
LFGQRAGLPFGTGVVHSCIQAAKSRDGPIYQIAHVFLAADIRVDEFHVSAESAKFSGECLPCIVIPTGDYDAHGASVSERESRGAANAGKRAGD